MAWTWVADWPEPGARRWLCQTCRARPVPSLHEVAAGLTAEERRQLEAEAAAGDPLARVVVDLLAENGRHDTADGQRRHRLRHGELGSKRQLNSPGPMTPRPAAGAPLA